MTTPDQHGEIVARQFNARLEKPLSDSELDDLIYLASNCCTTVAEEAVAALEAQRDELAAALVQAIPWIGESRDGPSWATPEAKANNRSMCDQAFEAATACFPNQAAIDAALAKVKP